MALAFDTETREACGTDAFLPIDGRYSRSHAIEFAKEVFSKRLRKYYGFKLAHGEIMKPIYDTSLIKL